MKFCTVVGGLKIKIEFVWGKNPMTPSPILPHFYAPELYRQVLLWRVLAMGILSVCLSVRPSRLGTDSRPREIETPGLQHMIA